MAMPSLCRAFGLLVETEAALPGALPVDGDATSAKPELTIRRGQAALSEESAQSGPYRLGREGLFFEKAGVAKYLCGWAGDAVQVEAAPGATAANVADYLIATVLPAVLWMRGELMLHGAAFVPRGERRAIALLGDTGAGKSTLLRGLVENQDAVVAEDSLCLRGEGRTLEVSGLPGCLHLRLPDAELDRDRVMSAVPPGQCRASAELEAVIVLEPVDDAVDGGLVRADAARALEMLLHHRHRPRVPELLGRSAELLPRWAALAGSVPVYFWRFPRAVLSEAGPGAAGRLLTAWKECMEVAL